MADGPRFGEDLFPFTAPPARGDLAAMAAHSIGVTDTTFRDGQQARAPYTRTRWSTSSSCRTASAARTAPSARANSS